MTVWINLGTAAATVLASGSIAAIVSHVLIGSRERRGLLRQKAEDRYVSVEAFENSWSQGVIALHRVVTGTIDYNQYLDSVIAQNEKHDGALNRRVEMLTRIYFPTTVPKLAAVRSSMDRLNRLRQIHKAAYLEGKAQAVSWDEHFNPLVQSTAADFESYKSSIVRCAQFSFTPMRVRDA